MAVSSIANFGPMKYIGLSTDTKPTVTDQVPGATFYETDSGLTWITDAVTWYVDFSKISEVRAGSLLNAMVTILGTAKLALWPLTERSKTQTFAYGTSNDAGALVINTSTLALIFDPVAHCPTVHSYLNDSATANMAAADDADYSHGDGTVDTAFSVGIWVKPNEALGTIRSLVAKYGTTATLREWRLQFDATGQLLFELYDESADTTEIGTGVAATAAVTPFAWNFCVATYDGDETSPVVHLYINGTDSLVSGATTETGAYIAMEDTTAVLMVGCDDAAGSAANVFQGRYALPFVTGKELTQANVTALYQLGRGLLGV